MGEQPWHRHICVWSWEKEAARPSVGLGKLSTKTALTSSTPSYARPQHYPELAKSLGFRCLDGDQQKLEGRLTFPGGPHQENQVCAHTVLASIPRPDQQPRLNKEHRTQGDSLARGGPQAGQSQGSLLCSPRARGRELWPQKNLSLTPGPSYLGPHSLSPRGA